MLKSKVFIAFTLAELLLLGSFFAASSDRRQAETRWKIEDRRNLVRTLSLTDFAIWTEARYTRHPSQADFFSPFQEFPSSFEHFPAGSIIAPIPSPGRDE